VLSKAISRRSLVLRTGFGLVLGLLALTILATYRIQQSYSQRSMEIQRKSFHEQEHLANLRRIAWLCSVTARDLFLNQDADQALKYRDWLHKLRDDANEDLLALTQLSGPSQAIDHLRAQMQDLWTVVQRIPDSPVGHESIYAFLMSEVSPRRQAATNAVERMEEANRAALSQSEAELAATRKSHGRLLLFLLGIDALIGLAVAIYSLRQSEQLEAQTQAQLLAASSAREELERLSARLMEIQEQERTRLARELHDDIVQNLAVLKIEITQARQSAAARSPELQERLERARSIADRTMKTLRSTMLLLRPSLLDDLGLVPALQWLVEDFQQRTGVRCRLFDEGIEDALPEGVKTAVFRVVQEALHNAEKHAQPKSVEVRITQGDNEILASVSDDGAGFKVETAGNGSQKAQFGLIGMRERATALGGRLHIESAPGAGSTITLKVPNAVPETATLKYMESS
jgi:signal transduction histidine kinase